MSETDVVASGVAPRSLAELEAIIDRGIQTFIDVGSALLEVRDRRLYRESHLTWDDYCRERWNMSRIHAHRLIEAAEVSAMLPTGNTPDSERQARELVPLKDDPDAVREVYAEVVEQTDGQPTARAVREAVDRRLGRIEPTERQAIVLEAIEQASPLLDEPETEKALYALSRIKFWLYLDPEDVAESAMNPLQDAPGYGQLAVWVRGVADALQARAAGLRVVR